MSTKITIIDKIEYTSSNKRMRYNPEFHDKHNKPFTEDDYIYICSMWKNTKKLDISFALGRTVGSVCLKKYELKKNGLFEYYKKLGNEN